MFTDSHCHLTFPELAGDMPGVRAAMAAARVTRALCISTTMEEFPSAEAILIEMSQMELSTDELVRAVQAKQDVRMRIDVDARFTSDADLPAASVFAEIPGSGPKANEVVMIGAHLDSWHTGTGAADNGAGAI